MMSTYSLISINVMLKYVQRRAYNYYKNLVETVLINKLL